jgi:hypothetical protein
MQHQPGHLKRSRAKRCDREKGVDRQGAGGTSMRIGDFAFTTIR